MKKISVITLTMFAIILSLPLALKAQDESQEKIIKDSKDAKAAFRKTDPSMDNLFKNAYGYAIFPKIGKGAAGIGGAAGNGAVFEKGKTIGTAKMAQITVGAQVGGQSYREVVFFESKEALDRFRENKIEFSGQVSAVAAKSGASSNANYRDGVVVFTEERSGLMLEASLGGQKFTYKPLK